MGNFLRFKKMITPIIIQVAFWVAVVFCVLVGSTVLMKGMDRGRTEEIISGVSLILLGPLAARVYCEILIVIFSIHDTLTNINNTIRDKKIITSEKLEANSSD